MIRLLTAILILVVAHAGSPAWAHASLVASQPADNSVVAAAPEHFVLEFNEPVTPIALKLVHGSAAPLDLTDIHPDNNRVGIRPPAGLRNDTYALSWRVISSDGHPVSGSVIFSIGDPVSGSAARERAESQISGRHVALWVARLVLYLGLFVGVGGSFFAAWMIASGPLPGWLGRALGAALVAGLVAVPLALALQGLDVLDRNLGAMADPAVWRAGAVTNYGPTLAIAAASLAAGWAALVLRPLALRRALATIALAGIGLALAASGHAATAEPQLVTRPSVFMHVVAIAFWTGAFLPLLAMLIDGRPGSIVSLKRFSRVIPAALLVLIATGLTLAAIQIVRIPGLWTTAYGIVFDAKMAGVIVLLGLGAVNRYRLTAPILAGDVASRRAMVRSIRIEVAVAFAVFALVSTWRFTPPPRALIAAAVPVEPSVTMLTDGASMAHLTLLPARIGPVRASVELMLAGAVAAPPKAVTLVLRNDASGVEPIERLLTAQSPDLWTTDSLSLPASGRWEVEVKVVVSDFAEVSLGGRFDVKP